LESKACIIKGKVNINLEPFSRDNRVDELQKIPKIYTSNLPLLKNKDNEHTSSYPPHRWSKITGKEKMIEM